MHGHRRLSGSRHALYDQIRLRRTPDNEVLLLLNRRNDFTEYRFFVLRQILRQELIIRYHIRIKKVLQTVIFNFIRPLSLQINRKGSLRAHRIAARPGAVFIIDRGNRRPPVEHDRLRFLIGNTDASDVIRLWKRKPRILKINPPEIRLFSRLLEPCQAVLIRVQLRRRIVPERQTFRLFRVIRLHQIRQILIGRPDICLRLLQIPLGNPDDLFKLRFLLFPRKSRNL